MGARLLKYIFLLGIAYWFLSFSSFKKSSIPEIPWGVLPSGEEVLLFTLTNDNGMGPKITNYGEIVLW